MLSGYLNCPVVYYNRLTEEVVSTDRQQPVPSYLDADLFIASPPPHFIVRAYGNICGTLVLSSVDGGTEYVDDAFNAVTIDYTVSKDAPLGDAPLFFEQNTLLQSVRPPYL